MGELYREQFPLLSEESLEEEPHIGWYHRRGCSMIYRNRARDSIKGAAAIITSWPDHWSTFLTYWWIGLGMISLTTFIIYNSWFSFSMIPTANSVPKKLRTSTTTYMPYKGQTLGHVYMHVVANDDITIDLNEYIPLIEVIASNYTAFCYHFIIVQNDTLSRNNKLRAEHINENALNLLFNEDITYKKQMRKIHNIMIEEVTLTKFMDNSPARKYWRGLPHQFVEFLIRATSIWEKGGIALNPLVLKSQWSDLYVEKLKNIFDTFKNKNLRYLNNKTKLHKNVHKNSMKFNKRVNNIRDIINALENENHSNYSSDEFLIEAENKNTIAILPGNRKLFSAIETDIKSQNFSTTYKRINPTNNYSIINNSSKTLEGDNYPNEVELKEILQINNNSSSILPLFLDFLFHRSPDNPDTETLLTRNSEEPMSVDSSTNKYESSTKVEISSKYILNPLTTSSYNLEARIFNPIIVPVKESKPEIDNPKMVNIPKVPSNVNSDLNRLTIDLKGNIIATKTSCHAFLGTIFNYAVHQKQDEKLTDFIISQLSVFCKGVVSSCVGIDLILL